MTPGQLQLLLDTIQELRVEVRNLKDTVAILTEAQKQPVEVKHTHTHVQPRPYWPGD